MATTKFEFFGPPEVRLLVRLPLDSSSAAISEGEAVTASGATSGYFKEVDAIAERVVGIAVADATAGASDGATTVLVDTSPTSIYRVSPSAGTASFANLGKTCDVAASGLAIADTSTTTDDILILAVDTIRNEYHVQIGQNPAGVA